MDPTNPSDPAPSSATTSLAILRAHLEEHSEELFRILRSYVRNCGATGGEDLNDVTHEIINEVTVRALQAPERFDPARPARAWLLRIGLNLIKQRRDALLRLRHHEESFTKKFDPHHQGHAIDTFDRLAFHARHAQPPPDQVLADLLARATPEDRALLTRIDLEGWHYSDLAREMGISEAALRKRHQRAILRVHQLASHKGGQPE